MPRFTMSKDGLKRTTCRFQVRLTEGQLEDLQRLANIEDTTWRNLIDNLVSGFVHLEVQDKLRYYERSETTHPPPCDECGSVIGSCPDCQTCREWTREEEERLDQRNETLRDQERVRQGYP